MENKKIKLPEIDFSKVEVLDMYINRADAPDYCDSYIISANYGDREATDAEVDAMNEDSGFVYEAVIAWLY